MSTISYFQPQVGINWVNPPHRSPQTGQAALKMAVPRNSLGDSLQLHPAALDYPQKNLDWIRSQLAHCHYGWAWNWIKPDATVRATQKPDGVHMSIAQRDDGEFSGDCIRLASMFGGKLAEKFKDQYQFYMARGNFKNSPWKKHYFILGWPKTQDASRLKQIDQAGGEIPPHTLIIDPSYQRLCIKGFNLPNNLEDDTFLDRYTVDITERKQAKMSRLPEKKREKGFLFKYGKDHCTLGVPFGFINQLIPQSAFAQSTGGETTGPARKPTELALMWFEDWGEDRVPHIDIQVIDSISRQPPRPLYDNCRTELPKQSPLYMALKHLDSALKKDRPIWHTGTKASLTKHLDKTSAHADYFLRQETSHNAPSPQSMQEKLQARLKQLLHQPTDQRAGEPVGPG